MAHVTPSTVFPKSISLSKWNEKPTRFESDILSLEIDGKIPHSLHGAFYRIQPDTAWPPNVDEDLNFNGDGNISCFYFKDGQIDFKNRFVRTERYKLERVARRSLFGRYRNPFTDDPRVQDVLTRTASNTHIVYHAGHMMSLKEDGPAYEIDATTLETVGIVDYNSNLKCPTHTAHPKPDSVTGELVAFGYEAKGEATPDVCLWTADKDNNIIEEVWFQSPWACLIHDFWVTENFAIFPLSPLKSSLERMKAGKDHFYWDETMDYQMVGVVPRRGAKPEDVKWFKAYKGCFSHTINGYEENGDLVLDAAVFTNLVFPFFPDSKGVRFSQDQTKIRAPVVRIRFNPKTQNPSDLISPESTVVSGINEFGRIDDRLTGRKYRRFWALSLDPTKDNEASNGGFNTLVYHDFETGVTQKYFDGLDTVFQEPCFVPRHAGAEPDDGFIVLLADIISSNTNELLIFEAQDIEPGPVARVRLPLRLMDGLHGSWVDGADVERASKQRKHREEDFTVRLKNKTELSVGDIIRRGQNGANGVHAINDTNNLVNGHGKH